MIVFLSLSIALSGQGVDVVSISQEMLNLQKEGHQVDQQVEELGQLSMNELINQLDTDDRKYVFWINVYNSFILHLLRKDRTLYDDRKAFFNNKLITIAGQEMSFADIEHGIIRRSQFQYLLGYLRNPFAPKYQKKLRPQEKDFRVHFALNCGAKSCPPVAILYEEDLNQQLNKLTENYLTLVTSYDDENNKVTTTPLASWFRGDFGGKGGTKKILFEFGLIPSTKLGIEYGPYDWTLDLDNFLN